MNAQKYEKSYKEYQVTTGVYFKDNVFSLYDDFVERCTKELVEEEIDKCLGEIDDFAEDMYNEEVFQNNNININS